MSTENKVDLIFELMLKYKGRCEDDSGVEYYSSDQVQRMLAEALNVQIQ